MEAQSSKKVQEIARDMISLPPSSGSYARACNYSIRMLDRLTLERRESYVKRAGEFLGMGT
jgi:hypothetical protein